MVNQRISLEEATRRTTNFFVERGCREEVALSVARALVGAEAIGLRGHGLSRLPSYATMLDKGKIDGQAVPTSTTSAPGVIVIDAASGFAYPAIDLAIDKLSDLCRRQGIAAAAIRHSSHSGAAGLHVERLAARGLVSLFFANTPAAIAPWGGRTAVFGTNPIAFGVPRRNGTPLIVDLSVSKVARGNILAAKQRGDKIPEGWALDIGGNPTCDPSAALEGTMLPMGDAKGSALALVVEILAGCLVGAHLAFEASSFLDGEGPPPGTGQLFFAMDPTAFGHSTFGERVEALVAAIESQQGARLPGSRRLLARKKSLEHGIEVPRELML